MSDSLELILVDLHPGVCAAWEAHFKDLPNVMVAQGRFENLPEFDCMVSAANSFGLMDGGVDLAIINYFGHSLMQRVQNHIIQHYLGEQPIGTSFIIQTGDDQHPYLAHSPTMRVPMSIALTDNVYYAMWATLLAVHHHNQTNQQPIQKLACPGLGTGYGRMNFGEAARQMSLAYKHYLKPPREINWPYATVRQNRIQFGGDPGFDQP